MSDTNENSNVQATPQMPVAATPPSTGPSLEDLQAKVAELERAKEGLIRDVQHERSKRQELETRPASQPVQQPQAVEQDEMGRILNPYVAPVASRAEEAYKMSKQLMDNYHRDQALNFLSQKTGKKAADVMADTNLQQRLTSIATKWNLVGPMHEVAEKAYELMELEDLRAKEAERTRSQAVASANTTLVGGTPPAPTVQGQEYSADSFSRLPASEFDRLSQTGSFRKVGDKFVYTPRS